MKLTFVGGAGTVTGAHFLLEDGNHRYAVDCGLLQGCAYCEPHNYEAFPYNPATLEVLLVTHAHIDHIGRIPKLVRDGFRGVIYSTPATRDLSEAMLEDAHGILLEEARRDHKPPLYQSVDIATAFSHWKTIGYHEEVALSDDLSVAFLDAGHIVGSAMVRFSRGSRSLLVTGDLGNEKSALLPPTEAVSDATYLVMESVYGNRTHDTSHTREARLTHAIAAGLSRGGAILIPAFSLERTQDILFDLRGLMEQGALPRTSVYVDSPLALRVTGIFERHRSAFRPDIAKVRGPLFSFPSLIISPDHESSARLREAENPKIIIAGSGMSHGGRVLAHEAALLPHKENTLLLVGYQAAGSLGRQLEEGVKRVSIFGRDVRVKAHVERITGYSGHRDVNGLTAFVEPMARRLQQAFVVMGEPGASLFLAQRLHDYLGVTARVPARGERVELTL